MPGRAPRNRKREAFLRAAGRPLLVTGADYEKTISVVRAYHARGMTYAQMERQTGVSRRTISRAAEPGHQGIKARTRAKLARLVFEEPDGHAWVDASGSRRRLAGLWADGFPLPWLSDQLDFGNRSYLQAFLRGTKGTAGIRYHNAREISLLFLKLQGTSPAAVGIGSREARFSQAFAAKKGFAPSACWDPDTVDDPEAEPEWTGRCGTWLGWHIHQRDGILMCPRCKPFANSQAYPGFDGALLRELRERKGLSRVALASRVEGVNATTIQYWEVGRNRPARQNKLDRVLSALDATLEDVCTE